MSEKFEAPFGQYDTNEMKQLRNEMQVELIVRLLGDNSSHEEQSAWVEVNSKDFAEILTAHPEILEEYRSGNKRLAVEQMEEQLGDLHEERFNKAA